MSRSNPLTTHNNAGIAAWRFTLKGDVHSYEDALAFLREHPDGDLGAHMEVHAWHPPSHVEVTLYETPIIRYYPDGTFSVDNGGFATPTTMYRLNAVLPKGWRANHHRKQLALRRHGGEWLEFWPCTHDRRLEI